MGKFCAGCGQALPEDAGFCPECGRARATAPGVSAATEPVLAATPGQPLPPPQAPYPAQGTAYPAYPLPATPRPPVGPDGRPVQAASVGARIGAHLLDLVGVALLWFAVAFVVTIAVPMLTQPVVVMTWAMFVPLWLAYFVVPTAVSGKTLGKLLLGLRVVRADGNGAPGAGKALGRYAVLLVMSSFWYLPAILCALMMGNDPWNRGWHDQAAGVMVVRDR